MNGKVSVVINTLNEEKNITRAIKSVNWADEIIVCDMYSEDKTLEIAKKLGAKVIYHKKTNYVEPARNFAVSKASSDWILVLDPDEEIPESLKWRLIQIAGKMEQMNPSPLQAEGYPAKSGISSFVRSSPQQSCEVFSHKINYVRIPRKNIIFNKWMKATGWWPDYNIRFFKKGKVKWTDKIHRPPEVSGVGIDLEADEKWAIIHHNYQSVTQFMERMNRYTSIEASQLAQEGYKFRWKDLINKPLNEFLSRFFAEKGYADGLHGFAASLLQASSFLAVYLKLWEMDRFKEYSIELPELDEEMHKSGESINYWIRQSKSAGNSPRRCLLRLRSGQAGHLRGVAKRFLGGVLGKTK